FQQFSYKFGVHSTMYKKKMYLKITLLAVLVSLAGFTNAQPYNNDIDVIVGVSVPGIYHAGIGLHYIPSARLGLSFGSDFKNDENGTLYELALIHSIYFGKPDRKIRKKLWAVNTGISFLVEQSIHEKSTAAYFDFYFIRKIPITPKIFIQPELGASYFLFEHLVDEAEIVTKGKRTKIIPKIGLSLVFKI
ncbi:MAG: hypothetical protein Q8K69_06975, partial [Bacteroidota bacterium]|nr:hypothetical protein [Bacteroidota bacterium]